LESNIPSNYSDCSPTRKRKQIDHSLEQRNWTTRILKSRVETQTYAATAWDGLQTRK